VPLLKENNGLQWQTFARGTFDQQRLSGALANLRAAETELRQMRDRVKHLEQALRTAGRALQPYLAGTGR
jgi:hypothetical protein